MRTIVYFSIEFLCLRVEKSIVFCHSFIFLEVMKICKYFSTLPLSFGAFHLSWQLLYCSFIPGYLLFHFYF